MLKKIRLSHFLHQIYTYHTNSVLFNIHNKNDIYSLINIYLKVASVFTKKTSGYIKFFISF